ncbi:bacillithiol system redox-active protein YtxJ [Fulvivirga imtechensis]|nr:bacillithiol system redox-active protein YtxJ [Fulvivirga imtechensis]
MNWIKLSTYEDLDRIKEESKSQPVVIFKHSTRCSISSMALNRLERSWSPEEMTEVKAYYLDLISYRDISNQISSEFNIRHESPQVLIVKNGEVIYDNSHMGINYDDIKEATKS